MLSLDLDHFKEANDVFGHGVGDELLCAIARRLETRRQEAFIARVGGDEFIARAAERRGADGRGDAGRRLLKAVAEPFEIRGQQIAIGLSIGGAIYPTRRNRRRRR